MGLIKTDREATLTQCEIEFREEHSSKRNGLFLTKLGYSGVLSLQIMMKCPSFKIIYIIEFYQNVDNSASFPVTRV